MRKDVLSVFEITRQHIKILHAKVQKGAPVLFRIDIIDVNGDSEKHIIDILSKRIQPKDFGALTTLISRQHCILKHITVPSVTEDEVHKMINLQIGSLCPYARDEVLFDYTVLEKSSSGYTKVLIAIVPKSIVDFHIHILSQCGLVSNKVVLSSMGILDWFIFQKRKKALDGDSPVLVIDIDDKNTELCFCAIDKLIFSRIIQFGGQDLAEEHILPYVEQIGLSMVAYKKEYGGEDLKKIVIVGNASKCNFLKVKLADYYHIPIHIISSLKNIPCEKKIASLELDQRNVSITRGLGCLLGISPPRINLMPEYIIYTKRSIMKRKALVRFIAVLLVAFSLSVAVYALPIYKAEIEWKDLNEQYLKTEELARRAKNKIQMVSFSKEMHQGRILMVDVMAELFRIMPENLSFRAIGYNSKGTFEMQGFADAQATVTDFQNRLISSPFFNEVNLKYATERQRLKDEFMEFKITCFLTKKTDPNGQ